MSDEADRIAAEVFAETRTAPISARALDAFVAYERKRERAHQRKRIAEHADPGEVGRLAESYRVDGRNPIVDAEVQLIRIDCPDCGPQDAGYRPMRAVPRGRWLTVICELCGVVNERRYR